MSDLLLEWMSFRGAGRRTGLPASLVGTSSASWLISDFATLGHLELEDRGLWRVAPPVLAGLPPQPHGVAAAILCGARTQALLRKLATACNAAGVHMAITAVPDRPSIVRLAAPSKSLLRTAADAAGIAFQSDAAFTLLACTPTIREWQRTPCTMVGGRVETVRRFSRSRVGWVASTLAEATVARSGFFKIKRDWDWVNLLKTGVSECAYIDERAGRLHAAARLRAVSWTANPGVLSLPSAIYPPGIIARALTLCSGALPQFDVAKRTISFGGISPEILRLMLGLTELRLV